MAVYQLENEHIYLEVASHGAELVRLVGKKTKKEYLFDGDPKYWKRHSPILFPFVGGVKNKEYRYNGKTYTMTQHGFARDMEFTLDSQTQDTLWFSIVSNETTMENYPFTFRLEVGYQLKGNRSNCTLECNQHRYKRNVFFNWCTPGIFHQYDTRGWSRYRSSSRGR